MAVLALVAGWLLFGELQESAQPPVFSEGGGRFGEPALSPSTEATVDARRPGEPTAGGSSDGHPGTPDAATSEPTTPVGSEPVSPEGAGGEPREGATASRAGAGSAPSPSPSSASVRRLRPPSTGRYRYDLEGWEATSAPGSRRTFPDTATVAVHSRQDGADGPSVTMDLTYSDDHEERMVVRYGTSGVAVTFEGGKVSFFGGSVTETSQTRYHPPLLRTAWPADVGDSWSGQSEARDPDDGSVVRRESYTGRVRGTEQLTVAGRTLTTFVVDWESQFTGTEDGWRRQRMWFSPDLGIWVKLHDRVHAERSGFAYDKDATITLREPPD